MRGIVFLLVALATVDVRASVESRIALVIGNAAYPAASLKNPVNDARAVAEALRQLNFDVVVQENMSQAQMQRAIIAFGQRLTPDSVGLFYYSGHGVQVGGRNFLIPVDADISSEQSVPLTALDMDDVVAQMAAARARINLVILDACRNNPFAGRVRSLGGGLAAIDAPKGTLIAYATAPGKVASDGRGSLGLYTQELLKAMRQPDMPVEQMFKRVRASVVTASNDQQTPWETSSLIGDFYFARPDAKTSRLTVPAPMSRPLGKTFRDCATCPEVIAIPGDLAIGVYDITFAEWDACVADGGCAAYSPPDEQWGRGRQPVVNVSWDDAQAYVQWLNRHTQQSYRLPTGAEWAAAAGSDAAVQANCRTCGSSWDGRQPAPVGAFPANAVGLHDMAGNIKQWTQDCHDEDGDGACTARVLRGGSWRSSPPYIQADARDWAAPTFRFYDIGFRVVRELSP
jgi:hypothetical protein